MESVKSIALLIIIICGVVFIYRKLFGSNYKFKFDTITHFQGPLGSGKTTLLVYHAYKWKKRKHLINKFIKVLNKIFMNKFDYVCEDVFSNFPIYFGSKLGWSRVCDKGIWTWKYKVPESCKIVFDELSNAFPNTVNGKAVMSDDLERFTLTWGRHAFDYTALTACQSLSEVSAVFRRKVQHCYNLNNFNRGLFRSRVNVVESFNSDDIKTIYSDTMKDHEENVFRFRNLKKNMFSSRYGKQFYDLDPVVLQYIACNTDKVLLLLHKKPKDFWDSFDYNIIEKTLKGIKDYEIKQNSKKDP